MTDLHEQLEDFRRRAASEGLVDVSYETHESPLGDLVACATDAGLVAVALPEDDPDELLSRIAVKVSPRVLRGPSNTLTQARRALDAYFESGDGNFAIPLDWRLTSEFQQQVLTALTGVQSGSTVSYSQLAALAGRPTAIRAAGTALARNPIPIVVPCHRVLQTGGSVGNYRGGPEMKRTLLALEGAL